MKQIGIALAANLIVWATCAEGREYHVNRSADNQVVFYSDAPLEDFEGVTSDIDGYVFWEGDDTPVTEAPGRKSEFYFEVNLDALDTGIGLRNRHMRENYLETDQHPFVSFKGAVEDVQKTSDSSFEITCSGLLDLHGVTRERSIPVQVASTAGGYNVTGQFVVKLEEHNIEVPQFMFLKIDQNIRLSIDFHLKPLNHED